MRTVLVTGGNRGIGLEICRQLDVHGYRVILGTRNIENGMKAARSFSGNVIVKQLDVTHEESILKLVEFIKNEFGILDILINNAGVGEVEPDHKKPLLSRAKKFVEKHVSGATNLFQVIVPVLRKTGIVAQHSGAEEVLLANVKHIMETNFYGAWRMIQVFIPLLQNSDNGKIINISSGMGALESLTGYYTGYSLSKSSLNALTIMLSNELKERGISVNAICPGWVKTDMGGPNATRSVSEGADSVVWLATEEGNPTGKFYKDRKEIDW